MRTEPVRRHLLNVVVRHGQGVVHGDAGDGGIAGKEPVLWMMSVYVIVMQDRCGKFLGRAAAVEVLGVGGKFGFPELASVVAVELRLWYADTFPGLADCRDVALEIGDIEVDHGAV